MVGKREIDLAVKQLELFDSNEYKEAVPYEKVRMIKWLVEASSLLELALPMASKRQQLRERVAQLLAGAAMRHGPTYSVAQLAPYTRLGHGVPTVRNRNDAELDRSIDRVKSDSEYATRLRSHAPFLADFDLRLHGMVLAGGAAAGILMRQAKLYSDFDLFLVGHASNSAALQAIATLANHLFAWHQALWVSSDCARMVDPMRVCRTRGCITFVVPTPELPKPAPMSKPIQIQVILHHYGDVTEVIRDFDLGSSAVAWDGAQVVLTAIGKFAAEHGANILNLAIRRASYERRLARYFKRGYDIVLPDLDKSFLTEAYPGTLPYMEMCGVDPDACCLCHLEAESIEPADPRRSEAETDDTGAPHEWAADRSTYEKGSIEYDSIRRINESNARALDRARRTDGAAHVSRWLCACENYKPGMSFAAMMPALDERMWLEHIGDTCGSRTDLKKLKGQVGEDAAMALVHRLMTTDLRAWCPSEIQPYCSARFQQLQALIAPIPLEFRTATDAAALNGDAALSAQEWYGKHYKSDK
jgi:hypothetical protein